MPLSLTDIKPRTYTVNSNNRVNRTNNSFNVDLKARTLSIANVRK